MLGIFLDLETNGLNPFKHRVLEIAFQVIDLQTGALIASYDAILFQPPSIWALSDPQSLAINGFTPNTPGLSESEAAAAITALFTKHTLVRGDAVFICQNPSFDRMFFCQLIPPETQESYQWPYHWLDLASMYWAKHPSSLALSKNAIATALGLPEETLPHKAMNGVRHLLLCYQSVVGFPLPQKKNLL